MSKIVNEAALQEALEKVLFLLSKNSIRVYCETKVADRAWNALFDILSSLTAHTTEEAPPVVTPGITNLYERFVHLDALLLDCEGGDPFRHFASEAWAAIKNAVTGSAYTTKAGKGE